MMPKGLVMGSCQADEFARFLNLNVDGFFFDVHRVMELEKEPQVYQQALAADAVFSAVLNHAQFGRLNTQELRKERTIITHTNIYFKGLHPDITHPGVMNDRMGGPMGGYHSQIILFGYARGLSPAETASLYNAKTYEALGYLKEWETSGQGLIDRDTSVDVRFAAEIIDASRRGLTLYMMNHPAALGVAIAGKAMADHIGLKLHPNAMDYFHSGLARMGSWPVMPVVAEAHGLPTLPPLYMVPFSGHCVPQEDMIGRYFRHYDTVEGREKVLRVAAEDIAKVSAALGIDEPVPAPVE